MKANFKKRKINEKIFLITLSYGGELLVSACSTSQIHNVQTKGEISKEFLYANAKCGDSEEERYLQKQIINQLKIKNIYGRDLNIKCKILHFDEGNRFARYMVGFGAGAATTTIKIELENQQNEKIGEFEVSAEMKMGAFGGSALNTLEESAVKIVNFVEKNYIK
ncbi:DUF4410 domain-containing protein [Campylobacter vulpis]|uniref:DUF4410 domain-containing protein n=1 Tax=Campylobacter vulpis TaxID=1655500 RepID=A0ABS5P3J9_9BACT|nr:DUF4410 domain-containing protein [Campylobacter vulpis]MBS4241271.1 DUF4410 domain-containing protein [Campylobacter vulpis]MBS4252628.1 DUF4410 domain-containing protein [Campylobacter vulpis]MBS4281917.1 DUF4410 domain-containing protein [Campylobacter vulpis]